MYLRKAPALAGAREEVTPHGGDHRRERLEMKERGRLAPEKVAALSSLVGGVGPRLRAVANGKAVERRLCESKAVPWVGGPFGI